MSNLYEHMPYYVQTICVNLKGWLVNKNRYGKLFNTYLDQYCNRDKYLERDILNFREAKLFKALEKASRTPFYNKLFNKLSLKWQDLVDPENFKKIPFTTKEHLIQDIDSFRPRPPHKSDLLIRTSGTTGRSLAMPISRNVVSDQWAVWWRYRKRHGLHRNTWCGLFASAPIVSHNETKCFYRINIPGREYRFSVYHISNDTVAKYVDALNKKKPLWIHGNPSAISLLARYMLMEGLTIDYPLRWLTVSSETMQPWQKNAMRIAFGINPVQHYGMAEAVANISECDSGSLHTDEDFSYVEYVQNNSSDEYLVIGTPFSNYAISILRYNTGDLVIPDENNCSCGRWGRIVKKIEGRTTDYITLPDGQKVASLASPFHETEGLAEAQIYQNKSGDLTIRYVPGFGWREHFLSQIEKRLRRLVGYTIAIDFKKVDFVERTERGKIKFVISELHNPKADYLHE